MSIRSFLFPTASGRPAEDVTYRWSLWFEKRDCWVGCFWRRLGNCLDIYICLVPCLPLHLCWHWHDPEQ